MLLVECTEGTHAAREGPARTARVFDPAMLDVPRMDEAARSRPYAWTVRVKRLGKPSTIRYPFNPRCRRLAGICAWSGSTCATLAGDESPLSSAAVGAYRAATSFARLRRGDRVDPGALKVPFFHNNDDYDEVIFSSR